MFFDNLIGNFKKNYGKIVLFLYLMLLIALCQRIDFLQDKSEDILQANRDLTRRADSLAERLNQISQVVFLQRIVVPEKISFADSVYELDPVTQERLYQKVIELMSTRSKMVAVNRRYENFNFIKHILLDNGLHPDFFYLSLQESLLDKLAVSNSGAKGLWQFMKSTGRRFGLIINWYIDERLDPVKSTQAAVRYLKYLRERYNNNYPLMAAAYNNGERKLNRAIREGKSDNYFGLNLHQETEDYFIYILAWKYIIEQKSEIFQEYGAHSNGFSMPYVKVEIVSDRDLRIGKIINYFNDSYKIFTHLNPTLYRYVVPRRQKIVLAIPKDNLDGILRYFSEHRIKARMLPSN